MEKGLLDDEDARRDEALPDRFGLAYIIMMLLGVGSLLPWNAMITPVDYLQLRVIGSQFEQSFLSILETSFTSACLPLLRIPFVLPPLP